MGLHPTVAAWFERTHPTPTIAQQLAIPRILAGENVLLSSPTGSGKTLAAFLAILSRLHDETPAEGVQCVYISPLKALASDIARNLLEPLRGMGGDIRVALRTGETPRAKREAMLRSPPHILVTTPESLALLLASPRWDAPLGRVRWVIVDEVHDLAPTKRGAHLALCLERLSARREHQRIGLSATIQPLDEAARFLCGSRECATLEAPSVGPVDIRVGMIHPDPLHASARELEEALFERLHTLIGEARTTIIFTNTRASAERIVMGLRERHPDDEGASTDPAHAQDDPSPIAPHHGSMSREERHLVEARLVSGSLKCVVASSSLELGVHVETADQVILLGSPKSAARALQRVGRSGHATGRASRGLLLASDPDELLEAVAVATLARSRQVEDLRVNPGGLDILAQHLIASELEGVDAWETARKAWPYRDLSREDFDDVERYLEDDGLSPATGRSRMALTMGGGAIPRAGLSKVVSEGRFVGEVEESFAEALQEGDVFQLAGSAWRVVRSHGSTLHVLPAKGLAPTVPMWKGEGISATPLVADATRKLLRGETILDNAILETPEIEERIRTFLELQGEPPAENEVHYESCATDDGRRALVVHAMLGRKANEALARGLAPRWSTDARPIASEWGFALVTPRAIKTNPRRLFEAPLTLPDLESSELFKRRLRHVCQRALGEDDPFSLARLARVGVLRREARRECVEDAMDFAAAEAFRERVAWGQIELRALAASPFVSPLGACILIPRQGGVASWERLALLREAFDWWKRRDAPRDLGRLRN